MLSVGMFVQIVGTAPHHSDALMPSEVITSLTNKSCCIAIASESTSVSIGCPFYQNSIATGCVRRILRLLLVATSYEFSCEYGRWGIIAWLQPNKLRNNNSDDRVKVTKNCSIYFFMLFYCQLKIMFPGKFPKNKKNRIGFCTCLSDSEAFIDKLIIGFKAKE